MPSFRIFWPCILLVPLVHNITCSPHWVLLCARLNSNIESNGWQRGCTLACITCYSPYHCCCLQTHSIVTEEVAKFVETIKLSVGSASSFVEHPIVGAADLHSIAVFSNTMLTFVPKHPEIVWFSIILAFVESNKINVSRFVKVVRRRSHHRGCRPALHCLVLKHQMLHKRASPALVHLIVVVLECTVLLRRRYQRLLKPTN